MPEMTLLQRIDVRLNNLYWDDIIKEDFNGKLILDIGLLDDNYHGRTFGFATRYPDRRVDSPTEHLVELLDSASGQITYLELTLGSPPDETGRSRSGPLLAAALEMQCFTNIVHLKIEEIRIETDVKPVLEALSGLQHLERLSLSGITFPRASRKTDSLALAEVCSNLPLLWDLALGGKFCYLDEAHFTKILMKIQQSTTIKNLEFSIGPGPVTLALHALTQDPPAIEDKPSVLECLVINRSGNNLSERQIIQEQDALLHILTEGKNFTLNNCFIAGWIAEGDLQRQQQIDAYLRLNQLLDRASLQKSDECSKWVEAIIKITQGYKETYPYQQQVQFKALHALLESKPAVLFAPCTRSPQLPMDADITSRAIKRQKLDS